MYYFTGILYIKKRKSSATVIKKSKNQKSLRRLLKIN